jgi:hypothetical protein
MTSEDIKNIIITKYAACYKSIIKIIRSQEFWDTCNTDEMGNILFFDSPTKFSSAFDWGVISLDELRENWTLFIKGILYLVPRPPAFRMNQSQEHGYPEPLLGYQPIPSERYDWTLEFAKIIDSWLMAAIIYDASSLARNDRLYVISKVYENPTLLEYCHTLNFSDNDSRINWGELTNNVSDNQTSYSNHTEKFPVINYLELSNIHEIYLQLYEEIIATLRSWKVWNFCNTYERGEYLFFLVSLQEINAGCTLVDLEDNSGEIITDILPGLIQAPYPPSQKLTGFPSRDYQPTVQERYDWTLELARRIDAWLAAIISYAFTLSSTKEDKLKAFSTINQIGTLTDYCNQWQFSQDECTLNWEE